MAGSLPRVVSLHLSLCPERVKVNGNNTTRLEEICIEFLKGATESDKIHAGAWLRISAIRRANTRWIVYP